MSIKVKHKATEKDLGRDLAAFEQLPMRTRELLELKGQAEKATGHKQSVISKQIEEKDRKSRP